MRTRGKVGVVLTLVAGVGMIATVVLTAKKAPEAQKIKEAALILKREETGDENAELTFMESVKAQAACYAPVILSGAVTVGSLIGSQVLPQGTLKDLERLHNTYKDIVKKVEGAQQEKRLSEMAALKATESTDGIRKETFVLRFDGKPILFETTLLDVMESEYEANRYFALCGSMTFNDLLDCFHIPEHVEDGDLVGWDEYLGDAFYGYHWIDFCHRKGMLNEEPVTFIDLPFDCHAMCEEELEAEKEHNAIVNG